MVTATKPLETIMMVATEKELRSELSDGLHLIPQAREASFRLEGNIFRTWVMVDPYEQSARQAVTQLERKLLQKYPSIDFDFYVVSKIEDSSVEGLFAGTHVIFSRTA